MKFLNHPSPFQTAGYQLFYSMELVYKACPIFVYCPHTPCIFFQVALLNPDVNRKVVPIFDFPLSTDLTLTPKTHVVKFQVQIPYFLC